MREIGDERKGEGRKRETDTEWEAGEGERKFEREIPREKGQRMRGRSSGSSEARVAGEGRGFESGVAFRGARSALSSREPGERERTCVPARKKRVVFSHPLADSYPRGPHRSFPPKEETRDKIATNDGCVNTFHFSFSFRLSVSRTSVESGRGTRE